MRPHKLNVMIADDEGTILEGLRKLIPWEKQGFSIVCEATDGMSAVHQARIHHPDVVIIDINMPILSGLEVIKILNNELADTVFIILSGYEEFKYAKEAIHLKVAEYLLKPVKLDELSSLLDSIRLKLMDRYLDCENRDGEEENSESVVYRIVNYINEHMCEPISLQQIADAFDMNPAYLSRLFKQKTGMNYHAYLNQKRICKAKSLLLSSDMSIMQISMAVGFSDYRSFTKAFKQLENTLPSHFRSGSGD